MINKFKNIFTSFYRWFEVNLSKIALVIIVHLVTSYTVNLPYINIFTSLFSFIPYVLDWIVIAVLFKLNKDQILNFGLLLFFVAIPFEIFNFRKVVEVLGEISFLMIGTYVILSLREFRK